MSLYFSIFRLEMDGIVNTGQLKWLLMCPSECINSKITYVYIYITYTHTHNVYGRGYIKGITLIRC